MTCPICKKIRVVGHCINIGTPHCKSCHTDKCCTADGELVPWKKSGLNPVRKAKPKLEGNTQEEQIRSLLLEAKTLLDNLNKLVLNLADLLQKKEAVR